MKVAFRVDSGPRIGNGHVMRCLNLAELLRRDGVEVSFICRDDPRSLTDRLEQSGFDVLRLPAAEVVSPGPHDSGLMHQAVQDADAKATLAALQSTGLDWMIVDHYQLGREWESAIRLSAEHVLAIDDLARSHDCDVLLDQNWFGESTGDRYRGRVPATCRTLLGPRFALLGREYPVLRAVLPPRGGEVRRVLVCMGGSDPGNQTATVLQALSALPFAHLAIDVVVGENHPDPAGIEARMPEFQCLNIYRNVDSLAGLLARADLAIGAGGITTWERACLGAPSIVTAIAHNQEAPSRALAAEGRQVFVGGNGGEPRAEDWTDAIAALIDRPDRLVALGRSLSHVTDGFGAGRVARMMRPGPVGALQLRPAQWRDEGLLLEWANEPSARKFALSTARISSAEHRAWLERRLQVPDCMLLIAEESSGLPVGQVRFDLDRNRNLAVISISVDVLTRGGGVGQALLAAGLRAVCARVPGIGVVAEVVEENARSVRLFLAGGFIEQASSRSGVRRFEYRSA